jgi:hypothetical protein
MKSVTITGAVGREQCASCIADTIIIAVFSGNRGGVGDVVNTRRRSVMRSRWTGRKSVIVILATAWRLRVM